MTSRLGDSFVNEAAVAFLTRDGWQNWTPTVTQNVAVAATVTYARYVVIGNTVIAYAQLGITGAGTITNTIIIGGIPIAIANPNTLGVRGVGLVDDFGTAVYTVSVVPYSGTTLAFFGYNVGNYVGIVPNFALANGDVISFIIAYEW